MSIENLATPTEIRKARILVVDDNPSTAMTLARAIAHISPNLDVVSATDGMTALEKIKDTSADLVITDMMMPDMNGLELIEKLRLHPGGGPSYSILITAYDVPGLKESARRIKVNETLIKPIHPERICQIVIKALEEMQSAKPVQAPKENRKNFKLLIADDTPSNVTLLSRYLMQEEYGLITAANGLETLEKTRAENPDLLLLDVNMPGKDGFQVLQEIRSDPATEHIPVIILTAARLDPADMQFALNLGADDYVTKPFDRRELLARIRTKLRVKEAEDAIRRRNKELSLLPEIGKDLSARLDIDDLTNVVLHRIVETLGALSGHIFILNSPTPLHKEYHLSSIGSSQAGSQLPDLDVALARMKTTHQGFIIDNTAENPQWKMSPDDPTRSVILVPLLGHVDLIGALILTHEEAGYFKLEHQLLLQAIASQAAIAVENAQLYAGIAYEQGRTAAVLQSVADPILMFDINGRLVLLNPAGEKLFGGPEAKLGERLASACGYEPLIELLDQTCTSGKPGMAEIVWPDGRVFAAQFTSIGAGGCVVLLHDVSHFKDLDRIKDEFISTASHDLKNPITSILGFSEIIAKAGPLNETQLGFARHMHTAAENMRQLVQDLLDLAKVDMNYELKKEALDLNTLVAETVDEFQLQAETKQQCIQIEKAQTQPVVQGDPLQLRQAMRNLVGNAIKYTPANGSIKLSVERRQSNVVVNVIDSGYGIPAEDLPFIFDRFYRVRNENVKNIEGSGLGLAIVKAIAEHHGGQITVESKPGQGSNFLFSLPFAPVANTAGIISSSISVEHTIDK
jgi:signal transduction histidine kinase/CheY-like chemotaxis protein